MSIYCLSYIATWKAWFAKLWRCQTGVLLCKSAVCVEFRNCANTMWVYIYTQLTQVMPVASTLSSQTADSALLFSVKVLMSRVINGYVTGNLPSITNWFKTLFSQQRIVRLRWNLVYTFMYQTMTGTWMYIPQSLNISYVYVHACHKLGYWPLLVDLRCWFSTNTKLKVKY